MIKKLRNVRIFTRWYIWIIVFLYFCLPDFTQAQSKISLSAGVDKATITIGDLITYSVVIKHDEDVEVRLPALGENLGGFEIRDYNQHEPRSEKGKIVHQVDYIISTFDVGDFEIPPVEIGYVIRPDSVEKVLKTENIKIVVESVKPSEDGDIRDLKPPWEISFNWQPVIIIGGIVLFVILLIIFIIYVIRKRRKGEKIIPRKLQPPRPPHEIAYEELACLAESDLLDKGEIKLYYSEISDIIRRYVEGRYQVIAMELTTTEVLDQLKSTEIENEHFEMFVSFFEICDLVKFAKHFPDSKENKKNEQLALQIVDVTKWIDPVSEIEPENEKPLETEKIEFDIQKDSTEESGDLQEESTESDSKEANEKNSFPEGLSNV